MLSFCLSKIRSSTFSLNKGMLVTRCLIRSQSDSSLVDSIGNFGCNLMAKNTGVVPIPSIFEVRYAKRQEAINKS